MSRKELNRLQILNRVLERRLTQSKAAEQLGLSLRQIERLCRKLRLEGPDGRLHPIQQAFIDELGPQCGFCTPGQIMSTVALLQKNPRPTRDEARRALSGNLCRCGAYDHYLNSVMRAAEVV